MLSLIVEIYLLEAVVDRDKEYVESDSKIRIGLVGKGGRVFFGSCNNKTTTTKILPIKHNF